MYAIIQAGGRQYKVEPGTIIELNRLSLEPGAAFETKEVLLLQNEQQVKIGKPTLDGVLVKGTVLDHSQGDKIKVYKMRRRKNYRRTIGHRQQLTRVRIDAINA